MLKIFILYISIIFISYAQAPPAYKLKKPEGPQVDSILASVNGEPISLLDVIYESTQDEARLYALYSSKEIFHEMQKLRKRFLDKIIDRKLILLEYKAKTPFKVPRQYVENLIDDTEQQIRVQKMLNMYNGMRDGGERTTQVVK